MNKKKNFTDRNFEEIMLTVFLMADLVILQFFTTALINLEEGIYSLNFHPIIQFIIFAIFLLIIIAFIFLIIFSQIKLSKKGAIKKLLEHK